MKLVHRVSAAISAVALLLAPVAAQADALIDNVNGITLDEKGQVVRFTGLLLNRDGWISYVYKGKERRHKKLDWTLDMGGRTMLPGMIDAHGHVMALGFKLVQLDLSGTRSLAEAQAKIAEHAKANPGRWIVGFGWNQERWGLGRFPTAAELDRIVDDRPVWLERIDGHAGWANTRAMELVGVTAATPDPAGGRIERIPDGRPAGVFVDAATALIDKHVPGTTPRERNAAFIAAQETLMRFGVTSTADMGTSIEDWLTYRRMGDRQLLKIRIMAYAGGIEPALAIGGQGPTPWLYSDRLRLGGIKLYTDGALGSRGAWLKSDYADAPGQKGLGFLNDPQLLNLMTRGAMDGFQLAVHAIGDRANQQVLDAIEVLSDTYKDDRRWRIEHAQVVDPADLKRFASFGVIASMQPVHQTSDRSMAEARLGPDRLTGAYAWRTILQNGGRLAFGSDYPVESPNPWIGWAAGFTRQDPEGQPPGGWRMQEALTREQAWAAFTIGAAYAGYGEAKFGRIAPAMRADFIIVDRDPLIATPDQLRATQVLETWINGERVYLKK